MDARGHVRRLELSGSAAHLARKRATPRADSSQPPASVPDLAVFHPCRPCADWHYFTRLAADAGESIIYNVVGNHSRLRGALDVMCRTEVCTDDAGLLG